MHLTVLRRTKFASVMADLRRLADDRQYLYFPVDIRFVKRSSNCLLSQQSDADSVHFNFAAWLCVSVNIHIQFFIHIRLLTKLTGATWTIGRGYTFQIRKIHYRKSFVEVFRVSFCM